MNHMFDLIFEGQKEQNLQLVLKCNDSTSQFGLSLSQKEAAELVSFQRLSLKNYKRIEFGPSVLPDLIFAFCDSEYLDQDNYAETLGELQDIFYLFKNESQDEIPDDELLAFMRQQFEEICFGDTEYLKGTCLELFSRKIRAGYQSRAQKDSRDEYSIRKPGNEYQSLSEETRWDFDLYRKALDDLE